MQIQLSRLHFPVRALGPGHRIGIWFQGCSIRCPGCISADTWDEDRGGQSLQDVLRQIDLWIEICDGITVTGGEPFDQPEALLALLSYIKSRTAADVLVFTGYEKLAIEDHLNEFAGLIDVIITGPYDASAGQTKPLRGSDNQILWHLTDLGCEVFDTIDNGHPERRLDMVMDYQGRVFFAGIPAPGEFTLLRQMLEAQGHQFVTTEDKRG